MKRSLTAPLNDATIPEASVATRVTSARPIISAAAVDAVRCGFRRALSRASTPATPPIRVAGQPRSVRERSHEARGEERDAEEDEQRAEAHPEQDLGRVRDRAEEPVESAANPAAVMSTAPSAAEPRKPARRQGRALAHGRDGRDPGRPDRGPQARDEGDKDPGEQRDDDRPGLEDETRVRKREADRVEQPEEALREQEPEEEADRPRRRHRRSGPRR